MAVEDEEYVLGPPLVPLDVVWFKRRRLIRLGYDPLVARMMADENVDVHELEQLVGRGASLEQAARILAA